MMNLLGIASTSIFLIYLYLCLRAPVGWQDSAGFHFGNEHELRDEPGDEPRAPRNRLRD